MNEPSFNPGTLPTFEPDPALWPRIVRARQRQLARRRWALAGLASAAVAVLAVTTSLSPRPPDDPAPTWSAQDESHALEGEWRRLGPRAVSTPGMARVRAIDAALQTAYDRGARDEDTASLWRQRNAALRTLIASTQDASGHEPTRL